MIEGLRAVSRRSGIAGQLTPREGGVPTGLGIAPLVAVSMAVALLSRSAPPGNRSPRARVPELRRISGVPVFSQPG